MGMEGEKGGGKSEKGECLNLVVSHSEVGCCFLFEEKKKRG